ncbi:MAG: hypothetical protein K8R99_11545 [Actinomycetia bacterium]|nr:hypothetical protein [Actinomycetes bacterium]
MKRISPKRVPPQREGESDIDWMARTLHSSSPKQLLYQYVHSKYPGNGWDFGEAIQLLQAAKTMFWTRVAVMLTAISLPISVIALIRS